MDKGIYIIEFKVDGKSALEQIKEKRYHEKYLIEKKPIYLIGIEFDSTRKNVEKSAVGKGSLRSVVSKQLVRKGNDEL